MSTETSGTHHVTAIAGEPQSNVAFYVGLLGTRLVPPWHEPQREQIEGALPPLHLPAAGAK